MIRFKIGYKNIYPRYVSRSYAIEEQTSHWTLYSIYVYMMCQVSQWQFVFTEEGGGGRGACIFNFVESPCNVCFL